MGSLPLTLLLTYVEQAELIQEMERQNSQQDHFFRVELLLPS